MQVYKRLWSRRNKSSVQILFFTLTWIEPFEATRTTPSNLQEPSQVTGTTCDIGEQGNLLSVSEHMKGFCNLWQFDYPEKCHGQSSCLLGFAGGSEAVTVGNPDDRHKATAGFYKYLHNNRSCVWQHAAKPFYSPKPWSSSLFTSNPDL